MRAVDACRHLPVRIALCGTIAFLALAALNGIPGNAQDSPAASSEPSPSLPIAIVPTDVAATVTGASEISSGKAFITGSGTVTSGPKTTSVLLPRRGALRVCAGTTVHFSTDKSVPASDTPGLMIALDHGAVETSFATGRNSDILLTPDFRILIGGEGSSEVQVRLGEHGDTCVDNPGANAPYVIVSSVFEGGAYRVQPGQRVMFQHGSLSEVVDQEKEPCGCPAAQRPNSNDFPLAQSAGLAPLAKPAEPSVNSELITPKPSDQTVNAPLVYTAPEPPPAQPTAAATDEKPQTAAPTHADPAAPAAHPAEKKTGFFHGIGRFFKRIFGAE